ncbi:MAG: DUF2490 domain-containing protein [Chitinophagales bacterium]|nr:DUF2490 domain-containing protein [Chitinophagales bacterium]
MRNFIFLILIFGCQPIFSQDYTQFWLRTSLQYKLNPKFTSLIELHHRMESLYNTESPFRYPLTDAFRLWLVYKLSNHETINFSPYAFFSNHPQIRNDEDVFNSNVNEHRIHLQYENRIHADNSWSLLTRIGGEYRIFERKQDLFRLRFREGIDYAISKKLHIQLYDELFLNTIHVDGRHIFDQNRIGLVSHIILSDKFKLELGVTHIQSTARYSTTVVHNVIFQTNWMYSL